MALKHPTPRVNRYKKSGKGGGFVLAVFLVCCCLLVLGGYLLHQYQQSAAIQKQLFAREQKTAQQPAHSSSKTLPLIVEAVPPVKQDYYIGDIHPTQMAPVQPNRRSVTGKAELAILVDDMGSSLQEARSLAVIGVPINFAIIPGLSHYREVADYATNHEIEILVHMPMQPKEYPQRRLEVNGMLLEYSDEELSNRLLGYLEMLPQAVGANNHMGSGFTENADKMRVVLTVLKGKGLFFLDSITTPLTSGPKVAAELKMRSVRRDVFLDNEHTEDYIRGQLAQAVTKARKNGSAIAICHPHATTIATLSKALPELESQGITLVRISQLVK